MSREEWQVEAWSRPGRSKSRAVLAPTLPESGWSTRPGSAKPTAISTGNRVIGRHGWGKR